MQMDADSSISAFLYKKTSSVPNTKEVTIKKYNPRSTKTVSEVENGSAGGSTPPHKYAIKLSQVSHIMQT